MTSSNHIIHIGYHKTKTNPKANIHIEPEGVCIVSPHSTITSSLFVKGALYGLENTKVKGEIMLYQSGYSACFNCSTSSQERGDYYLGSLTVHNGGVVSIVTSNNRFVDDSAVKLILHDTLDIDYGGTVQVGDTIVIYTQDMKVQKTGLINANGAGYPQNSGPGSGYACGEIGSGGGSYGGLGGTCTSGVYGSACTPTHVGSGGGSCSHGYTAGTGGGAIKAVSSRLLVMEGQILSSGVKGSDGTGGGSGGAIWLDGLYLEGWGYASSNGASATRHSYECGPFDWDTCYHYGGGGGGGRIRTFSPNDPHAVFIGRRKSSYGVGYNSGYDGKVGTLCLSGSECSGHGIWNGHTKSCQCESGFVGSNCQVPCDPEIICSGNGVCSDHGSCVCNLGYVGYRCEYECDPVMTCSGNGVCSPHGECLCNDCFHGDDCSLECSGNGECMARICRCESCYIGEYCHSECNHHGSCLNETCDCDESWRGEHCTVAGCPGVDEDCSGNGICNAALHQCYCEPGWQGLDCGMPDCPGEPNCFDRGFCNATTLPPQCQDCQIGWMGPDCNETCLHGVQQPMDSGICVCDPCWTAKGCNVECSGHGQCDSDRCVCDPLQGWRGDVCEIPGCPGFDEDCSGHGDCNSALHECTCYPAWTGVGCHIPDCPGEPDCNDRGFCNGTLDEPTCQNCSRGWMGPGCEEPCVNGIQIPMDSGYCDCLPGWTGVGCDVECSAHGKIVYGKCECDYDTGWKGELCDVPGCPGLYGLDCSGRGACDSSLHKCVCNEGWQGLGCEDPDCPGNPDCAERGFCNGTFDPPRCVNCSVGWMGPACEDPCVNGFQDPVDSGFCNCTAGWTGVGCDAECSLHGTIINGSCWCDVGWRGEVCDIPGCPGDFGLDCSGHGECNSATHECICNGGWAGDGCEIPDCPGNPDCFDRGHCNVTFDPPECTNCIQGWMGVDCNYPCTYGHQVPMDSGNCECFPCYSGKGCNAECSSNGICRDGTCECDPGWWGEVCEVPGCPGVGTDCSGHGDCNAALHQCYCFPGWIGDGCEIPDCPGEPDCNGRGFCNGTDRMTPVCTDCIKGWMGPECNDPCTHGTQVPPNSGFCQCDPCYTGAGCNSKCSGKGECNEETGKCICDNNPNEGYLGDNCEIQGCPGEDGACNGRGTCNSVKQKCTCYPGWTGYDCSIPDCPGNPSCSGKNKMI